MFIEYNKHNLKYETYCTSVFISIIDRSPAMYASNIAPIGPTVLRSTGMYRLFFHLPLYSVDLFNINRIITIKPLAWTAGVFVFFAKLALQRIGAMTAQFRMSGCLLMSDAQKRLAKWTQLLAG